MNKSSVVPNTFRVNGHITKNFFWYEALYHPRWGCFICPDNDQYDNIIKTAKVMQKIRDYLGKPIHVTSWLRVPIYNQLIGGAQFSKHIQGLAVDFVVDDMDSDDVRRLLQKKLEEWDIRMEDSDTMHVHIDLGDVIYNRYFKP